MSIIIVNPIGSSLEQEFTFNLNTRMNVAAFYPYLAMIDSPAGVFTCSLERGADVVFQKDFTSADIKTALSTTDNYAHVFLPIIPDYPVQIEKGLYKLKITSGGGYVENEFKYMGWIQQFENIQNEMAYTPVGQYENSLAFRLKEYKEGVI